MSAQLAYLERQMRRSSFEGKGGAPQTGAHARKKEGGKSHVQRVALRALCDRPLDPSGSPSIAGLDRRPEQGRASRLLYAENVFRKSGIDPVFQSGKDLRTRVRNAQRRYLILTSTVCASVSVVVTLSE